MVTIEEIAQRAGVSTATVSRALSGAGGVSEATRARIIAISEEMGRNANRVAQYKQILYLAVPSADDLLSRILKHADSFGFSVMCKIAYRDSQQLQELERLQDFDGIILADQLLPPETLQRICSQVPLVQCRSVDSFPTSLSVTVDDFQLGKQMTEHMLARGAKRVAYVQTLPDLEEQSFSRERFMGYQAAVFSAGIYDPALVFPQDRFGELLELLGTPAAPDAIIFAGGKEVNDYYRIWQAQRSAGMPMFASLMDNPALDVLGITTAEQPLEEMALAACQMLYDRIQGRLDFKTPCRMVFDPVICPRLTTELTQP